MKLRAKRVYEPPAPDDGRRILVDRLWPRGLTKERAAVDVWLKEIAPSTELRKQFHAENDWEEFQRRYRVELDANPEAVARFREIVGEGPATLLYGVRNEDRNHALLLCRRVAE